MKKEEYILLVQMGGGSYRGYNICLDYGFTWEGYGREEKSFDKYTECVLIAKDKSMKVISNSKLYDYAHLTKAIYNGDFSGEIQPIFEKELEKLDKKEEVKTYTVTEQFIKEAHTAACSTWKTKLEKQFPDVFPKNYSIGNKFSWNTEDAYMLSCCNENTVVMINVNNGHRVGKPVEVKDVYKVTTSELRLALDYRFEAFKLKQ